jgi:hypothetical protein
VWERGGGYRVLVRKPEGRRQFETPRHRWENNIKTDLLKVVLGHGLDQSGSGQGQVASSCEFGNERLGAIKCGKFLDQLKIY